MRPAFHCIHGGECDKRDVAGSTDMRSDWLVYLKKKL